MSRRRAILTTTLLAAVLIAGALLAIRQGSDGRAKASGPHAMVGRVPRPQLDRILNAAQQASSATSKAELVAEGGTLFRSAAQAKAGESCQACHTDGGGANADAGTIVHPQQAGDFRGPRDVPSLWGIADTAPYGWDGRTATLEEFVTGTIVSHFRGGTSQPAATTARQVAALTAYLRTLDPPATAFDQGTLSAAARRGEGIFVGKGACAACHGGPLLTDDLPHATFVPKLDPGDTDTGAAGTGPLRGAFDTPHLRDLRNTAPYMHNGSLKTLREVVEFYNQRSSIAPLRLTPAEIDDLVAYLESL
jgi:cytochrome c peroxidase